MCAERERLRRKKRERERGRQMHSNNIANSNRGMTNDNKKKSRMVFRVFICTGLLSTPVTWESTNIWKKKRDFVGLFYISPHFHFNFLTVLKFSCSLLASDQLLPTIAATETNCVIVEPFLSSSNTCTVYSYFFFVLSISSQTIMLFTQSIIFLW